MSTKDIDWAEGVDGFKTSVYEFLSRRRVMMLLTMLPALGLFAFVSLVPIVWAVVSGFYEIPIFGRVWTWVGLENYQSVVTITAGIAS